MSQDMSSVLMVWILICLVVACISVTTFPIMYSFTAWKSTALGKLLMFQAVAFALAMDFTLVAQFIQPMDTWVLFGANAFIFTLIAVSTSMMTYQMWRLNHPKKG